MSESDSQYGGTPATITRRRELVAWMRGNPLHQDLTAHQIASISGIYDNVRHGRSERCFDDLKALAEKGMVFRHHDARPARWLA